MRGRRDDDDSRRPGPDGRRAAPGRVERSSGGPARTVGLVGGVVLALGATAAVFLTDNPQYLRLAVIAVAWAFAGAAFLAGRRRVESLAVAERIAEVRRRYEHELDREAAASREYELELENRVRREAEEAMRSEVTALRGEMAALAALRDEVARVAALRHDLTGLTALRHDVASLTALRDDVASLSALRHDVASLSALRHDISSLAAMRDDVASLAELRTDMGRLRAELAEQLNGEMLIERILLRTQASRPPAEAEPPRTVEAPATWEDDRPPQELTGGWPAVRLDEPHEPWRAEPVPATSWAPAVGPEPAPWSPPTRASWEVVEPGPATAAYSFATAEAAEPAPGPRDRAADPPQHSRHAADLPAAAEPPPRRRRGDERFDDRTFDDRTFDDRTEERPAAPATAYEPIVRPAPRPTPHKRAAAEAAVEPETAGHQRLAEILAENGLAESPAGRRRRRHRDAGEDDDVLARVLRGG